MSFLFGALSVVFAFGLVIFVHEFGHFIVAKKTGVRVDRFSFGLGPEMVGFKWGETRYCLAWIPLGGEVRMAGEMELEDAAGRPAARDPREFFAQPWYRRIPIVVAGPAMNYVLAFFLFALVSFVWGVPTPSADPVVGEVAESYPAAQAGLKPGDRVISIDGLPVEGWKQVAEKIHASAGKPLALKVRRGEGSLDLRVTPLEDKASGRGLIGITPATVQERMGFGESLKRGVEQCWGWSKLTVVYLAEKIVRRERPELSGPVGIASVVAKAAQSGPTNYLSLIALISVGIGLFNLFPIPMLDGGHMAFYLWEGVFRRPASRRVVQAANMAGLAALLSIFLFATYSDIQRLRTPSPSDQTSGPK
jgi:regulator of sigma E protease